MVKISMVSGYTYLCKLEAGNFLQRHVDPIKSGSNKLVGLFDPCNLSTLFLQSSTKFCNAALFAYVRMYVRHEISPGTNG